MFGLLRLLVSGRTSAQYQRFDLWCWFNLRLLTVSQRVLMKIYVMQIGIL